MKKADFFNHGFQATNKDGEFFTMDFTDGHGWDEDKSGKRERKTQGDLNRKRRKTGNF
jgi:hypothetical protein